MSLLENEKVQEFFAPKPLNICACKNGDMCMNHAKDMAYSVLEAMSEPIKKGESYLQAVNRSDWTLLHDCPADVTGFHPFGLRLPSAHQLQRPPSGCDRCYEHATCKHCCQDKTHAPPPADKCGCCKDTNDNVYHEVHCRMSPSPTPPHTRENCQHIGGWCTLCKPEPRGEFGDDLNEAVFKTVNAIWNGPAKTHNEIEVLVRALLRFSRAAKPEAHHGLQ